MGIAKIDPQTGRIVGHLAVPPDSYYELIHDDGAIWASTRGRSVPQDQHQHLKGGHEGRRPRLESRVFDAAGSGSVGQVGVGRVKSESVVYERRRAYAVQPAVG